MDKLKDQIMNLTIDLNNTESQLNIANEQINSIQEEQKFYE